MTHLGDGVKHSIDAISVATVIGTLANFLPAIAALFTIIWTTIRIYETETVRKLMRRAIPVGKDE